MSPLDCLLIHTPKFNNYYQPTGHFTWVNYVPMGLLGLADHLERNGHACRILHQGVQWMNDKSWRLEDSLPSDAPPLIALSLHWHQQAYDVIETCKRIRGLFPTAYIALGGFTASFFDEELVRDYDCIDGVLRGDSEMPLLELVRRLKEGEKDLGDVANLTWRNSAREVVRNRVTYCATQEDLDGICFSNMELLHNHRTYVDYITFPFMVLKYVSKEVNFKRASINRKMFPITLGRGCPMNCTWCAGSFGPQKERISCRQKVVWRSHDAVINDIKQAKDCGYDAVYSVFDPTPQPQGQDYFIGLFRRLREEGLAKDLGWMHESTGLASKEFADEFAKTFSDDFRILGISPETGNERVRRMNKGYYYSNQQLYEMLDHFARRNIELNVYLTYGIPGENEDSLRDTIAMRAEIAGRYGRQACVRALSIEIEPGAPWQVEPEKYGVVTSLNTFKDFYEAHGQQGESTYTGLGYYIPEFFKKPLDPRDPEGDFADRLQKLKCKHLCFFHPDVRKASSPFWGRMFCRAARALRFLARKDRGHG